MKSYTGVQKEVASAIKQNGFKLARDAMEPLSRIDFSKLVLIHDHEEHFLQTAFIDSLITLRRARVSTKTDLGKITADDVETALRMLGIAAARQAEQTLSKETKGSIKDACPFC